MQARSMSATPAIYLSSPSMPPAPRSRPLAAPAPMPGRRQFWFGKDSPIKTAEDLKGKRLAGKRGGWGQFLIDATLEKAGFKIDDATFAPLGPVDAKIALVAGSIDGWAVWEPYVSYATLKDNARVVANGEGLTPTITFIVASDSGDRHQARGRAGSRPAAQQGAAVVARSPARIRKEHRRTDQIARGRTIQRLYGAADQPDRDRCQHRQRGSGGLRPRYSIRHSLQDARCRQSPRSQLYGCVSRVQLAYPHHEH